MKDSSSKIREIHFSKREEILHRGAAALVSSGGSWWVINHSQNYLQPKVVKCLRAGKTEKYKVRGKWGLAWGLKESTHGKECFDVNTRELESVDLSRQNISVGCLFSEHSNVFPKLFPITIGHENTQSIHFPWTNIAEHCPGDHSQIWCTKHSCFGGIFSR